MSTEHRPEQTTEIPEAAKRAAEVAVSQAAPTCAICGVEYLPGFAGTCAEPLGPLYDGSRVCGGEVKIQDRVVAERVLDAVAPILTAPLREELEEVRAKLAAVTEKYDELRDNRFEEGCDECQKREDEATARADSAERRLGEAREALNGEIAHLRELAAGERREADRPHSAPAHHFHARATVYEYIAKRLTTLQDSQVDGEGEAVGHDFAVPAPSLAHVLAHFESEANAADELALNSPRGIDSRYEVPWRRRYEIERDTYSYVLKQIASATHPEPTEGGGSGAGGDREDGERIESVRADSRTAANSPGAASTSAPEEDRWKVGQIVRHGVGSEWELIEHVGGRHDDWRARCIKAAYRGGESLDVERTFHREYMDRSFTVVAPTPEQSEEPTCGGGNKERGRNRSGFLPLEERWKTEAREFRVAAEAAGPETASLLLAKAEVLDEILVILGEQAATSAQEEYEELETVDPETDPRFAPTPEQEPTCERCGGSREICRQCGMAIAACICYADRRYRPTEPCPDCSTQDAGGEDTERCHGRGWYDSDGPADPGGRCSGCADCSTQEVERWTVDYENAEGEPQHAVLSWLSTDPTKELPEVGTELVRLTDLSRIRGKLEIAEFDRQSCFDHIRSLVRQRDSRLTKEAAGKILDLWEAETVKVRDGAPGDFDADERRRAEGGVEAIQRIRNSLDAAFGDDQPSKGGGS